jgi:predicted branched-subunit amino acid permease
MGLSPSEAMGMTLLFYSGSAQMAVLQLMQNGALPITMVVTALVINLRFLMYSASLAPHFSDLPRQRRWSMAYLLSDQSFALCTLRLSTRGPGRVRLRVLPRHRHGHVAGLEPRRAGGRGGGLRHTADLVAGVRHPAVVPGAAGARHPQPGDARAATVGGVLAVLAIDMPYNLGMLVAALGGILAGLALEQGMAEAMEQHADQEAS